MKKGLITILFCVITAVEVAAQLVISKPIVFIKDDFLTTSFKIQNLLGQNEIKTIQSGFTTTIKTKVELWKKGMLFHDLKTTHEVTKDVSYDIWEKIYTLKLEKGKILKFDNLKEIRDILTQEDTVMISALKELDLGKRYFVRVKVDVESINEKQIQEISRRINGQSSGLINIKEIFSILVKHRTKDITSYAQSDYFRPDRLK
ncbi:MAG: DUF4390 domain-containing protein [bacterium]